MKQFVTGGIYSRKQVRTLLGPISNEAPEAIWNSNYFKIGKYLVVFANATNSSENISSEQVKINDHETRILWFGKPNAHSEQPVFRALFQGKLQLLFFVRWNEKDDLFTFLSTEKILSFSNDHLLNDLTRTIKIEIQISELNSDDSLEEVSSEQEGRRTLRMHSYYERNPRLRLECIRLHGVRCKICDFDFRERFGELGANFCHVHHIEPLSEVGKAHLVSPLTDLIPVCPNCHAMLHRVQPALQPKALREIIESMMLQSRRQ